MIFKHATVCAAALVSFVSLVSPMVAVAQDVPLPQPRPELEEVAPVVPLPRQRPVEEKPTTQPAAPVETTPTSPEIDAPAAPDVDEGEPETAHEPAKPARVYQVACPAVLNGEVVATALPPIAEGMCGLRSPLSLEAVIANGRTVPLNGAVTTDCGMASALPGWVADIDRWLMATENTRIAKLNVGTGYMCRNVNNASSGNLSFHGFADALDVIGFTLEDGRTISVETAWPGTVAEGSKIIRFAHDAACTRFTTVLGPEANALHHDHLHIDLGCHGKSCTARLCE